MSFAQNRLLLLKPRIGSGGGIPPIPTSSGRFTALYYNGLNMQQEFLGYYYINSPAYRADTSLYLYFNNI